MDGSETPPDALDLSLKRLAAAIDLLERAAERRMRHDDTRANAEEEYALMQDDRSRLAVELDAAPAHARALDRARAHARERLASAAETIGRIIDRMGPPAP